MITRAAVYWRRIRRWFTRSYWELRIFPLSKSEGTGTSAGLVMIQIDGLSQKQMRKALHEGKMPFLKRLLEREHYKEYAHYSGLPSSTPAVQGELFYGVKTCVPSFQFYDRESNEFFLMFDPKNASEIEKRLARENRPLLQGGSSYSNIYAGGADEAHFCASTIGWQGFFKSLNPFSWIMLFIFHIDILLRTLVLLVVEFILALYDCIRGVLRGEYIFMELQFILTRVLICTLLRELIVLGVKIDMARGLPIIHANFFGYDEQAHRRGPSSAFAHWSLKGIDDSISRIWKEARLSERREYDLWIYSDHGQEDTIPYPMKFKKNIETVVEEIFTNSEVKSPAKESAYLTASCCAGRYHRHHPGIPKTPTSEHAASKIETTIPEVAVRGMGPLCHIYPRRVLSDEEKLRFAKEIILKGGVPVVLIPQENQKVLAVTKAANYGLPEQASAVLGQDHPFLEEITKDLMNLCFHSNAGQMIISGWLANQAPMTFPVENGSHAGFGSEETNAFAILPLDAPLPERAHEYLRPLEIREAALQLLGRGESGVTYETPSSLSPEPKKIRIASYNVHGCLGMDGKRSTGRIARVIARYRPDAIAMQELDAGCSRSEKIHQAETIASKLQMNFHFHPSFCLNGHYDNGILSQHQMRLVKVGALPQFKAHRFYEPRGVLWVEIDLQGTKIQLLTTHLSIWAKERIVQTEALLSEEWLGHPDCRPPVILAGDFNSSPTSRVYKRLTSKLYDAQLLMEFHRPSGTWLRPYSFTRIDHVLVSPGIKVNKIIIPETELDRIASDHFPLFIDLEVSAADAPLKPFTQSRKRRFFDRFKSRNENGENSLTEINKENSEGE